MGKTIVILFILYTFNSLHPQQVNPLDKIENRNKQFDVFNNKDLKFSFNDSIFSIPLQKGNRILAEEIQQFWVNSTWKNHGKWIYKYNPNGKIIELTYQMFNSINPESIDWQRKILSSYDDNGNLVKEITQLNDYGDWYNGSRTHYKYDENRKKVLDSLEIWNDRSGTWQPTTKHIYIYDENNNVIKILERILINGIYFDVAQWLYQFDQNNNMLEERYQVWDSTGWRTGYLRSYIYDNDDNIIEYISKYWSNSELDVAYKFLYSYDEKNNKTEEVYLIWDDSAWVNKNKIYFIYDNQNNLIEENHYNWNNSEWNVSYKTKYSYDYNWNKILRIDQYYWGSNFINSNRSDYSYDPYNNLVLEAYQFWDNNLGWINSARKLHIYVPEQGVDGNIGNYWLANNYPNPFNSSTIIRFLIPKEEFVTLIIYNILGQQVQTLLNEIRSEGVYEVNWEASNISSGIYFYQIKAGEFIQTKKMILLK